MIILAVSTSVRARTGKVLAEHSCWNRPNSPRVWDLQVPFTQVAVIPAVVGSRDGRCEIQYVGVIRAVLRG